MKALWTYIKAHNLQDPDNKRTIVCDEALKRVFEVDQMSMFEMNKLLGKHFLGKAEVDPAAEPGTAGDNEGDDDDASGAAEDSASDDDTSDSD